MAEKQSALEELRERLEKLGDETAWKPKLHARMRDEALKTLIVGAPAMSFQLRETLATNMAIKAVGCVSALISNPTDGGGA